MRIEEYVISYLVKNRNFDGVSMNLRVREDLKLDGDDAEEFFENLEEKFKYTKWRDNFYDYFQDEYSCTIHMKIINYLFSKKKRKTLTVECLVNSCKSNTSLVCYDS